MTNLRSSKVLESSHQAPPENLLQAISYTIPILNARPTSEHSPHLGPGTPDMSHNSLALLFRFTVPARSWRSRTCLRIILSGFQTIEGEHEDRR